MSTITVKWLECIHRFYSMSCDKHTSTCTHAHTHKRRPYFRQRCERVALTFHRHLRYRKLCDFNRVCSSSSSSASTTQNGRIIDGINGKRLKSFCRFAVSSDNKFLLKIASFASQIEAAVASERMLISDLYRFSSNCPAAISKGKKFSHFIASLIGWIVFISVSLLFCFFFDLLSYDSLCVRARNKKPKTKLPLRRPQSTITTDNVLWWNDE